ncbi:hypothetical protein BC831DRAFT_484689 [Entophlyctis helioformis]|nr:hypothetical protein BC831DRAFT_484689 [Entophlyctis helioformis]
MLAESRLSEAKVDGGCDSIYYVPGFVSEEEASLLVTRVFAARRKWTTLRNRRLQNWGVVPVQPGSAANASRGEPTAVASADMDDGDKRGVPGVREGMPAWLATFGDRIAQLGVFDVDGPVANGHRTPNHCLINEYRPGQGIMPHEDGPNYLPAVATITLGEHCLLDFYPRITSSTTAKPQRAFSILTEPRSLLVLHDDAYKQYLHGIDESFEFWVDESVANVKRTQLGADGAAMLPVRLDRVGTRLSLTFRVWRNVI